MNRPFTEMIILYIYIYIHTTTRGPILESKRLIHGWQRKHLHILTCFGVETALLTGGEINA